MGEEDPSPSKLPAKSTHWKNTRVIKSSWLNVEKEEEPVFDLNFSRIPDVESFLLKRQAVSHLNSVRGGDMASYVSKESVPTTKPQKGQRTSIVRSRL